jgi:hypothetical protein
MPLACMFTYVFFVHDQMIVNKLFLGSKKTFFSGRIGDIDLFFCL